MRSSLRGIVEEIVREAPGRQELIVRCGEERRVAINYTGLLAALAPGDSVRLNTWAVELGLGTGGFDFVAMADKDATVTAAPGHIMKLRYTPLQHPVLATEAQESPHHQAMKNWTSLETTPVVCAELHSQIPAIAAAAKWETGGEARVVYIMTDSAALPIAFSNLVTEMKEKRLIDATITSGQAFGGEYEAVNLYSAMAVAKEVAGADIIIVSQGPGSVGTGTPLGFSGVDQGMALNAAASLDGTAIAVARLSFSDPRKRHLGLSHHTLTVLQQIALVPALVPLPKLTGPDALKLKKLLEDDDLPERHEAVLIDAEPGLDAMRNCGIEVTTMGRRLSEDSAFFLSAAAAGLLAGQWIQEHERQL
jgi:hypothetical protein